MEWINTLWAYILGMSGWQIVGFTGQAIFGGRFVIQWIVTEREKKSTIPVAFWYLSLVGTLILLTYSIHRKDPVFILGFSLNLVIYLRNLYFIHLHKPAPTPEQVNPNPDDRG